MANSDLEMLIEDCKKPVVSTGEPVAWRWKYEAVPAMEWQLLSRYPDDRGEPSLLIEPLYRTCKESLQVASGDVRAAVIEECAKIAESYAGTLNNDWNKKLGVADDLCGVGTDIADAIRAIDVGGDPDIPDGEWPNCE